ncbi:hypothetical protein GF351_01325 [Candidatus Woesearchaeota archaeon]|nr:hypothetical protein [Candidatus Woesearchaeota archaeon]
MTKTDTAGRKDGKNLIQILAVTALVLLAGCGGITGLVVFESGGTPNIMVKNISKTNSSAFLQWNTSVNTTSVLKIGNSTLFNHSAYSVDFGQNVTGLESNSTYSFNITACTNTSVCNYLAGTFLTDANPSAPSDTDPPSVSVSASATNHSAVINWTTDENSTCTLDFINGSTNYSAAQSFSAQFDGLENSTTYHFNITACDLSSNCNITYGNFTTDANPGDTNPPSITLSIGRGDRWLQFNWTTDENSTSGISLNGTSASYPAATNFSRTFEGLLPHTNYPYNISACDSSQNCRYETGAVNTRYDYSTPSINITNISATDTTATIRWATGEEANSTLRIGSIVTSFGFGTSFSGTVTGLQQNTSYSFNITACDSVSNCNTTNGNFTTNIITDEQAPTITVLSENRTGTSAVITWQTSEPSNSSFSYASGKSAFGCCQTNFSVALTGLQKSTTYEYNITACDNSSNCAVKQDSFSTLSDVESVEQAPEITISSRDVTETAAVIKWTTSEPSTCIFMFDNKNTTFEQETSFSRLVTSLKPGTTYSYSIKACDADSNCRNKEDTFTTLKPAPEEKSTDKDAPLVIESPGQAEENKDESNNSDMISAGMVVNKEEEKMSLTNLILIILIISAVSLTLANVLRTRGVIPDMGALGSKVRQKMQSRSKSPVPPPKKHKEDIPKKEVSIQKPPLEEIEQLLQNGKQLIDDFQFEDCSEIYTKVREFYADSSTTEQERARIYEQMMDLYDKLLIYSMILEISSLAQKYRTGYLTKAEYYSLNMFMRQLRDKLDRWAKKDPEDKNLLIYALNEYNKALNIIMWRS